MSGGSSKDLTYRIVSTADGDGFKKTAADAEGAAASMDKAGRKGDELAGKKTKVSVETDADQAATKLKSAGDEADKAGKKADSSELAFSGMAGKMATLAATAGAVAPVLAALPAVLGAAAGAGAVLALAGGGVIGALRDYSTATQAVGISGAQLAATAFSNAVAIRNAQQAIADARRQASMQAASSADSLASAEERLGNAEQQAQIAERDLTQARQDGARALLAANETAATAALDVRAAQLALLEAQKQQIETNNALTSTALDRAKAELAVEQAQNSLTDTTTRAQQAQQDAAKANKLGVEGSQQVVTAKRAEQQAQQGVTDAQRSLAAAQRDAANAQITSAEQVQKAVQNLSDTMEQQKLAAAAAASSGASSMAAFNKEMAKLTPVGREVVMTVIGMRGGLEQLKATGQNTVLPGVLTFLGGARSMFPEVNAALAAFGTVIGSTFAAFGNLAKSPIFQGQFLTIMSQGAILVGQLGSGMVGLVSGLSGAAAKAGPILTGLGTGFQTLMSSGIPDFFTGLTTSAVGAGNTLFSILQAVSGLLGPIGTLAGAVSGALGPAMKVLAPVVTTVAQQVVHQLLPYMPQLTQAFLSVALAIGQIAPLIAPLIGIMAGQFVQTLQIIVPLVSALANFFQANATWLIPLIGALVTAVSTLKTLITVVEIAKTVWATLNLVMDANPVLLVVAAIAGLVAAIGYAWTHFKGFRDFITGLPGDFARLGDHLWDWIGAGLKWAVNGVIKGINMLIHGINDMVSGASDAWTWAGVPAIPTIPDIPLLASGGTIVRGGLAVVGERGPEVVQVNAGSRVFSNAASNALFGGAGGGGMPGRFVAEMTVKWPDGRIMDKQLVEFQRQGGVLESVRTGALAAFGSVPR